MNTIVVGERPNVGDEVTFGYALGGDVVSSSGIVVALTVSARPMFLVADDRGAVVRLALTVALIDERRP